VLELDFEHIHPRPLCCLVVRERIVGEWPSVTFSPEAVHESVNELNLRIAIEFCRQFEEERQRTEQFVKLLKDNDLFELKKAVFTPRNADGTMGAEQPIAEYFAVSEEKLNALSPEKLVELQRNGALAQIYAHLISLLNWDRLIAVTLARGEPTAGNA